MTQSYSGGCACGANRYDIPSEPVSQLHCQCRDCQRMSGTGHGSYLAFLGRGDVTLTGEAKHWETADDSGSVKTRAFCSNCGSPVYMTFPSMPDVFAIHAASLDDPSRFSPQKVMYHSRHLAWDVIDPALTTFEKMPTR